MDKHERPYRCPDPACKRNKTGFTRKEHIDRHKRNCHISAPTAMTDSHQQPRTHCNSAGGPRNTEPELSSESDPHRLTLGGRKRKCDSVDGDGSNLADTQKLRDQIRCMQWENDVRLRRLEGNQRRPA